MHLTVRNTNDATAAIFSRAAAWSQYATRNGVAFVHPGPITITYENPLERVNFCPKRDANPFFHLGEALWMCAGRQDVEWVADLVPRMTSFSDDGKKLNAAYGFRMRHHFRIDQLQEVASLLHRDPLTRQAVIQLWSAEDLVQASKDKPCNTEIVFSTMNPERALDMTVFNRSNDAVWGGVSGANVVHFSVFLEYLTAAANLRIGKLHVVSNNLHVYENAQGTKLMEWYGQPHQPLCAAWYGEGRPSSTIVSDPDSFLTECAVWCHNPLSTSARYKNVFLHEVATPMMRAHYYYKRATNKRAAKRILERSLECDWTTAGVEWLRRRKQP